MWNKLPSNPQQSLLKIDAQYKRNQDSRDLPSAAELQKRLLPNPIELQNYTVETFFQPSAYLSGDWFDYWKISDKEVMFYLADVSGHGVTSSLLTSWMAAFHGRAKTPRELIKKLNGMLVQENIEKHITMIAGILNLETHQLRWSSAGHYPPAIIFEPNQAPKILHTSSFPLGLTEELEVEEHECVLNRHARFIICSDGALEPFNGGLNDQFRQLVYHLQNQSFRSTRACCRRYCHLKFTSNELIKLSITYYNILSSKTVRYLSKYWPYGIISYPSLQMAFICQQVMLNMQA